MRAGHYENFPVASVLSPPRLRHAVLAIYQFARTADDIADEGSAGAHERLADLAAFRADLAAVFAARQASGRWPSVFGALQSARATHDLPLGPLSDLLDAFEQDVRNPVYADRDQLLDYCARSANPIGRLLLHLYRVQDAASLRQSDAICSALQLINFWQDLSIDLPRGRDYVPASDLHEHAMTRADLQSGRDDLRSRRLVAGLCRWAADLMAEGAPLALTLPGRGGWELRLVVQGGLRILAKIDSMEYRSLKGRPRLGPRDMPIMLWRALRMRSTTPGRAR